MITEEEFNNKLAEIKAIEFNKILIEKVFVNTKIEEFLTTDIKDHRAIGFSKILEFTVNNYDNPQDMIINVCKQIIGNSLNAINEETLSEKKDFFTKLLNDNYHTFLTKNKDEQLEILIKILNKKSINDLQEFSPTLMLGLEYLDTYFEEYKLYFFSKDYNAYKENEAKLLSNNQ